MPSFKQLFTIAACAMVAYAVRPLQGHCDEARVLHNTPIEVDGVTVSFTGFSCAARPNAKREIVHKKKNTVNVCGELCSNSCNNNAGNLPPTTDDCGKIKSAITIFAGQTSPTFTVAPYGLETLTFGTCSFFFQNNDFETLEYCWSDLSIEASQAGSACFPPEQPFTSEGVCTAGDGSWVVGAAHSPSS